MPTALRAAALAAFALAVLLGAAWLTSRAVSDRMMWSQYVSWVPSLAVLAGGGALLAGGWLLSWPGGGIGKRRWLRRAAAGAVLTLAGAGGYVLLVEWRLQNALSAAPAAASIRILNWNITGLDKAADIVAAGTAQRPDIAVLVNANSRLDWGEFYWGFNEIPHVAAQDSMVVLSRYRVIRHGAASLGVPRPEGEGVLQKTRFDPGRALYVELDTSAELGRPLILWVIDLPSSERLSRWETARQAAAAIAGWSGIEVWVEKRQETVRPAAAQGFPRPDVITGDFNIPRGSASLGLLAPGMRNAFDEAGWGYAATWPRRYPVFHIDQTFVGPGVRAMGYWVVDPGVGKHRMQVTEIVGRK